MSEDLPSQDDKKTQPPNQASQSPTPDTQSLEHQSSQSVQQQTAASSSSSGPSSASQSSSGSGTASSADTIPVGSSSLASVPEEPEVRPWGRLLPMKTGYRAHECVEDKYEFGRHKACDYVIMDPALQAVGRYHIISKRHFRIVKEDTIAYVEDLSNNGTFINGSLIGKDKRLPLVNNYVLAVAEPTNKVFMFIDMMADEQTNYPQEFRQKYLVTRVIGTGVCGEVKLAFERSTCKKVAVKIIHKKNFPSVGTADMNAEREIRILQTIDHPCLIKTEDFYQSEESYYIVLQLMEGGELFERVKSNKALKEPIAKLYFYQMLCAVEYLHNNGIIHRDLKPENILLASQEDVCLVKVTDFNQSKILEEASLMKTLCGTSYYLAPEVFTHSNTTTGYGPKVDSWSLGVVLFICLCGYPPFHKDWSTTLTVQQQITQGFFRMLPEKWDAVSKQAKDLVKKLLVVDPTHRLSIQQALQHPWLQDPVMLAQARGVMDLPEAAAENDRDPGVMDPPEAAAENARNPGVMDPPEAAAENARDPIVLEQACGVMDALEAAAENDREDHVLPQQGGRMKRSREEDEEDDEAQNPAKKRQVPPTE